MNSQLGFYGSFSNESAPVMMAPPQTTAATIIDVVASLPPPPPPEKKKKSKKKASEREKSVEILCKICNINCSSKLMYDDHCAGKKHLRREKEARVYSCEVCGVFCITAAEQEEHFKSQLHEESIRVREYLNSQNPNDDDDEEQGVSSILTNDELNEIKVKNKLTYKTCELCKVQVNSRLMWEAHIMSRKHKSREQDVAINNKKIAEQFSCSICDVLCYSADERELHLKSDQHLLILKEKILLGKLAAEKISQTAESVEEQPKDEVKVEIEPMVTPIRAGENALWYPCDVCNVKMNSMENYKDHINSRNHKLKEKGFVPDKKLTNQKYKSEFIRKSYQNTVKSSSPNCKDPRSFCARCEIQFETALELEAHFLDPVHKAFVPRKRHIVHDTPIFIEKRQKPDTLVNSDYGYGGRRFECTPAPPPKPTPPPIPPPHFFFQQPQQYPPQTFPPASYQSSPYAVPPPPPTTTTVNNYPTPVPAPVNYGPPNNYCGPPNTGAAPPPNNFIPNTYMPGTFTSPPPPTYGGNFSSCNPVATLPVPLESLSLPPPPPPPAEKPSYSSLLKKPTYYRLK